MGFMVWMVALCTADLGIAWDVVDYRIFDYAARLASVAEKLWNVPHMGQPEGAMTTPCMIVQSSSTSTAVFRNRRRFR